MGGSLRAPVDQTWSALRAVAPGSARVQQNAPKSGRLRGCRLGDQSFAAAPSICRVMYHCCAIDRMLLTTQYSTRPAGNHRKKKVKITGSIFITLACIGSGGVGLSSCWIYMLMPIRIGRMNSGSLGDRSVLQPIHGAGRISTLPIRVQYSAMNTGICTRIGGQPPGGLIFPFLYSSIMPWDSFWR